MDTLQYKDIFISESLEHLDQLNQCLLNLEQNPTERKSLDEIFRMAHTLKGMAATMGFDHITELTHQMENVLDPLRAPGAKISQAAIDLLFECLDTLSLLVEEISTGVGKPVNLLLLLEKLKQLQPESVRPAGEKAVREDPGAQGAKPAKESKEPRPRKPRTDDAPKAASPPDLSADPAAPEARESTAAGQGKNENAENLREMIERAGREGYLAYGVKVRVAENCSFKGVRAFMVYKSLSEHGEVLASEPEAGKLQEGSFERDFRILVLSTRNPDFLERGLKSISELDEFQIRVLQPQEAETFFIGQKTVAVNSAALAASAVESGAAEKNASNRQVQSIRVSIERLDNLQNLVGELVINKITLSQIAKQYDLRELKEALAQFDRVTNELQDEVTEVRMVPMEHIFNRFPRMVRDLAKERNKELDLEMEGKEIELDRTVLDEINDPLVHLLRNAVDHGVEAPEVRLGRGKSRRGSIHLAAMREKNHVIITVSDDGNGIDPNLNRQVAVERGMLSSDEAQRLSEVEAVNLVSLPGFSTAPTVTEISGRGVGLDVVRSTIVSFGGSLKIESELGKGSKFILRMPMTLAIIQALLVRIQKETYAIPVIHTVETFEFAESQVRHVQQGEVVLYREGVLPLVRLQKVLQVPGTEQRSFSRSVLVADIGDMRVGLLVDEVMEQQEIAIKSLSPILKGTRGFSGVTILGDGKISLVLDIPSLL